MSFINFPVKSTTGKMISQLNIPNIASKKIELENENFCLKIFLKVSFSYLMLKDIIIKHVIIEIVMFVIVEDKELKVSFDKR